jgi:hypothetical protein
MIARWMMRAATRRPPSERAEWAHAMEREYEELDGNQLGWAAGCLITVLRWKLQANWLYLVLLVVAPILIHYLSLRVFTAVSYPGMDTQSLLVEALLTFNLLAPLPFAAALGYYRPNHVVATMLTGGLLVQHVAGTLVTAYQLDSSFFSFWGPGATLYMAPPPIALIASLAVWYFGGVLGRRLAAWRSALAA